MVSISRHDAEQLLNLKRAWWRLYLVELIVLLFLKMRTRAQSGEIASPSLGGALPFRKD